MSFKTIRNARARRTATSNGRKYFAALEAEMHLEGLDPDEVQSGRRTDDLKRGPATSRLGGRIDTDLKRVYGSDRSALLAESDELLNRPAVVAPDEED